MYMVYLKIVTCLSHNGIKEKVRKTDVMDVGGRLSTSSPWMICDFVCWFMHFFNSLKVCKKSCFTEFWWDMVAGYSESHSKRLLIPMVAFKIHSCLLSSDECLAHGIAITYHFTREEVTLLLAISTLAEACVIAKKWLPSSTTWWNSNLSVNQHSQLKVEEETITSTMEYKSSGYVAPSSPLVVSAN